MKNIDEIDLKILRRLQKNNRETVGDLADAVGLSQNACWRRVSHLRQQGYVREDLSILDADKLGVGLTVFVLVRTNEHSEDWLNNFSSVIQRIDEVLEFHRLNGDFDYLLKLCVGTIDDYDRVYKKIIRSVPLTDVSSYISMERIKQTTALPLQQLRHR